jgi:carbonic anhydrase
MKKLLQGIAAFRSQRRPDQVAFFAEAALEHAPDAMMIACGDSRVVPNVFASADPGDLFVLRNVGNLVPPHQEGDSLSDSQVGAAIEQAVLRLKVRDVVICGHSNCGAMSGLMEDPARLGAAAPHLCDWLSHARPAMDPASFSGDFSGWSPHDALSQRNVLLQLEHLRSYPFVASAVAEGRLKLHGWWFDIATTDVFEWRESQGRFCVLDEALISELLS